MITVASVEEHLRRLNGAAPLSFSDEASRNPFRIPALEEIRARKAAALAASAEAA
jgi:hypothetical protein